MEDLYKKLCSYENLYLAFKKARKHKTLKSYIIEFEKDLKNNLLQLRADLLFLSYRPEPLETFTIRDPKTRKISKSDFRDRIVHHALCNIIEPIFEKSFIYDSYANRKGKGTLKAIERFEYFARKSSKNSKRNSFVLKADIYHYFETVNHQILIEIINKKIKDIKIIWLIKLILNNFTGKQKSQGMPLGNLTSQFFANVYLNELDQFVKHTLKAKYYLRYVDDFVILDKNKEILKEHMNKIVEFLKNLKLSLHPQKSSIRLLKQGISFLGFRIFQNHRLILRKNLRKFRKKLSLTIKKYEAKDIKYDEFYDFLEGWIAYSKNANSFSLRKRMLNKIDVSSPVLG